MQYLVIILDPIDVTLPLISLDDNAHLLRRSPYILEHKIF